MKYHDLSLATPVENLACDEALLDWCEDGGCAEEILRFWETRQYFVVVGYGDRVESEVNVAACEAAGVPVLRRCSGGGTVLQGPGCLNYALILRMEEGGPLASISKANRFVMERNGEAIRSVFDMALKTLPEAGQGTSRPAVAVRGHTDLALDGRKCSGNSQRRRKRFLLFHGTFLLDFDIAQVERFLPMPSKQPAYRDKRSHADFLVNLGISAHVTRAALRRAWGADRALVNPPLEKVAELARERYGTREWNFRL